MVDLTEYRLKLSVAAILGLTWFVAIVLPVLFEESVTMPPAGVWCTFAALFAYFFYTGFRAWRRGWRSRFILRVVVPISLLVVSGILEWAGVWRRLLESSST